jgi:hypothetical protein
LIDPGGPLRIPILPQPNDETCGPTSLHAVYQYFGYDISLDEVIAAAQFLPEGGTLAVFLGLDAIGRGFQARIYTYNLKMFDPTWANLGADALQDKLEQQLEYKPGKKFALATQAYRQFLSRGGEIRFDDPTPSLFSRYFERNIPILSGLSATYLYQNQREYTDRKNQSVYDDLKGEPMGHFVVLAGYDDAGHIRVCDPYPANPISQQHFYDVDPHRLVNAIMLGVLTYDANLLIIAPKEIELP